MAIYISILRGINVSGHRTIKMETLRQLYADLGFENIKTYIQSGNVVFKYRETGNQKLSSKIERKITAKFGFEVPVLVVEIDELKKIVKGNPFIKDASKDLSHLHVTFLSGKPAQENLEKIKDVKSQNDEFQLIDRSIYLYCPGGYSNSKFTNSFLENKLKVMATTRNWKTTNELLRIAENI